MQAAICVNNGGYPDDLKVRTVYRVLPDEAAAKSNYVRIIDETGEDYLYPASYFVFAELPEEAGGIFAIPAEVGGKDFSHKDAFC
jgi:hypothetical protein